MTAIYSGRQMKKYKPGQLKIWEEKKGRGFQENILACIIQMLYNEVDGTLRRFYTV